MSTIEELFLATKPALEKSIQEALDAAMEKIYTEYLPHVENDTYFNVRSQAKDWIMRYIAGTLREDDIKIDFGSGYEYSAHGIRQKIYEDNKEAMQGLIAQDMMDRLKDLQERHNQAWERKY